MQPRTPVTATQVRHDAALAVGLGLASAFIAVMTRNVRLPLGDEAAPIWQWLLFSALMALPLAVRRLLPVTAMVLSSVAYIVGAELGAVETTVSQVVLFMAFYSVGAWSVDRTRALWSRCAVVLAMAVWLIIGALSALNQPGIGEYGVRAYLWLFALRVTVNIGYFGGAWFFGDRSWRQARERDELAATQAEVRAQQALLTDQAVALERMRIARELHDVVAHHVSAMGIQAGAARRVLHRDPERAEVSLRAVEEGARCAIAELGTMVGSLRSSDEPGGPTPTLADVGDLLVSAREHGPVELSIVGTPRPLTPAVELTTFRIIQEALTNVRKHAGSGARADVRLRYLDQALEVEIADDGCGATAHSMTGLSVGQTGMAERVGAVGGTIEMRPRSRGGYLVRAALPAAADAAATDGVDIAQVQVQVRSA